MRADCPERATCSRLGGLCQCAEEEAREARSAYACPQCGPDPKGAVAHAAEHHAWPPGIAPAYERLREGAVARTIEVSGSAMVDVDGDDLVLGVETLDGGDWRDALADLARAGRLAVPRKGA
jgi:hypothetical protein